MDYNIIVFSCIILCIILFVLLIMTVRCIQNYCERNGYIEMKICKECLHVHLGDVCDYQSLCLYCNHLHNLRTKCTHSVEKVYFNNQILTRSLVQCDCMYGRDECKCQYTKKICLLC